MRNKDILTLKFMTTKFKHKSRSSAVGTIKRFFANTADDSISIQDAFKSWGRDLVKVKDNKAWLSNKLTHLKFYELVTPIYSYGKGPRKLEKLELTLEGKRELGRIGRNLESSNGVSASTNGRSVISLEEIMKAVPKLRKENPEFEITFDVRLKGL